MVLIETSLHSLLCFSWQNHNYAVDPASLPEGVEVTHINLNDGSCAGLAFPKLKIMSLQYHPEASPGPHDSDSGNKHLILTSKQFWSLIFFYLFPILIFELLILEFFWHPSY